MTLTIIGIDPGSRITGIGIIQAQGAQHRYYYHTTIQAKQSTLAQRLMYIYDQLIELIRQHQPDHLAIEQAFTHVNPQTALKLGQARAMAFLAAAQYELPIHEYAARRIKQAITGYGAADKQQVQHMVRAILNLKQTLQPDAADGLAIALCHAQHYHHAKKTKEAMSLT